MQTRVPGTPIQTDEKWIDEWIRYGFAELTRYLVVHARFDRWLVDHDRK